MTNSDRGSGVRRPALDGDMSSGEPLSCDVRGFGVVLLDGGFVTLVLGNKESPPEGTLGDIVMRLNVPLPRSYTVSRDAGFWGLCRRFSITSDLR